MPGPRVARLADEAWAWIEADEPDAPLGFQAVCVHFGLDAKWFRERLREWRATRIRRMLRASDRKAGSPD
jgi:hypothetical protein